MDNDRLGTFVWITIFVSIGVLLGILFSIPSNEVIHRFEKRIYKYDKYGEKSLRDSVILYKEDLNFILEGEK